MTKLCGAAALVVVLLHSACAGTPSDGASPASPAAGAPVAGRVAIAPPLGLPNFDALYAGGGVRPFAPALARSPLVSPTVALDLDPILGQPTFLRAAGRGARPAAAHPADAAGEHLRRYAPLYRLTAADLALARVQAVHDTGVGPRIVTYRQELDGIELFRREMKVVMRRDGGLVAIAGNLAPQVAARVRGTFALSREAGVASAIRDIGGFAVDPAQIRAVAPPADGYQLFALADTAPGEVLARPARVKRVLFELGDRIEPGYYVEVMLALPEGTDFLGYSLVVSAVDGRVLFRNNLVARDAFAYRVWADTAPPYIPYDGPQGNVATPHPTGFPNGYQAPMLPPVDVALQNSPFTYNDPWLAPGATETVGNNVDAYVDLASPDGYQKQGDFRATTTAPGQFLRTFDLASDPTTQSQRMAAITQLFFINNFLHDWYYDAGFDEAAGNAQQDNYGRGGTGRDPVLAEGQDYSGRDNANMTTPRDGSSPTMQMYLWTALAPRYLDVTAPAAIAGRKAVGSADFGPLSFNVPGDLVMAAPADACATLTNGAALAGKIALIDRGACNFSDKTWRAQSVGAIGAVIVNNTPAAPDEVIEMAMGTTPHTFTIPTQMISYNDGAAVKTQLAVPTIVSATMVRVAGIDRDSSMDGTVVAHEWGHYISNRLIYDANGLNTNQAMGLGEGWGDFHALLMIVKAEDAGVSANEDWNGVYGTAGYLSSGAGNDGGPNQGYYFGIRRVPYSTDFTKNALTFQHLTEGVPLPAGVPTAFGADGADNAEVHSMGEVWATMLWECYAGLLRDSGRLTFDEARDRMKRYLVAAYKATPQNPTFVEARDALLSVAYATDRLDCGIFGAAFARRGIGAGAVAPARTSATNTGIEESYVPLCVNGTPTANAGANQSAAASSPVTLDGTASSDPENDPLTFAWSQLATDPIQVTLSDPTAVQPTFTAPTVPAAGATLTFELVVTDSLGATSAVATTQVFVYAPSFLDDPVAVAGPEQTVAENTEVELDGSRSYAPDDAPLAFAWTQVGGPVVAVAGADTARPRFVAPVVDADTRLVFRLVVTAGGRASAATPTTVTVRAEDEAVTAEPAAAPTASPAATEAPVAGCHVAASPRSGPGALLLVVAVGLALRRRRR